MRKKNLEKIFGKLEYLLLNNNTMKKFIITEEEKNRILGLYEQVSTSQTTNNIFTQNGYTLGSEELVPEQIRKQIIGTYPKIYKKNDIILAANDSQFYFVVAPKSVKHLGPYDIDLDDSIYRDILKIKN